ncbi:MAG: hypothetical protein CMN73_04405 [Sphingomonas sp.]|nr:hypothetical protein [Sphingomonas sp.]
MRTQALARLINFVGIDLTGAAARLVVVQNWDNDPDSPEFGGAITTTANGNGSVVTLGTVTTSGGVPTSPVTLTIGEDDMASVPDAAEVGNDVTWKWYLELTPIGGTRGRYLEGDFIVGGSLSGAGSSAVINATVADATVAVTIDGATALAPLVATAVNAASVAEAAATLAQGEGNIYATRAEAEAAGLSDGEWLMILADEDQGDLRTLNRVESSAVVYYETIPSTNMVWAPRFTDLSSFTFAGAIDTIQTSGHSVSGLGGARYNRVTGSTAGFTETVWRTQIGANWYEIDPRDVSPASFGALPTDDDHDAMFTAMIAWAAEKEAVYPLRWTHPGFELLITEQITFQNLFFDVPFVITGDAYIRALDKTTNGTLILQRNSWVHFAGCGRMVLDGGGAQGVLGNNGYSGSGLPIYGDNRSKVSGELPRVVNCRIDPFYRGGKVAAPQQGYDEIKITICGENSDGGVSHEPDFGAATSYVKNAEYDITLTGMKYFAFWGLCGNGPNMDPSKESNEAEIRAYNCGGEGQGRTFTAGDVDTVNNTITVPDHGYFTRSTILIDGAALPGGISIDEYWAGRVDKDTLMIASSASQTVNVPHTSFSVDSSGRVSKVGHNFTTGLEIAYLCPTGWTEPDPDNPASQRDLSVPDSVAPTGLTHLDRFKSVRLSHNFFALTLTSATFRTFTAGAVNLGADTITIPSHGFSTGDAVRISIGANNTSISSVDQLMFALQTGTAYTPGTAVNVGSTEASGNDQYKPDTVYYIRAIDANTVALYLSASNASTDTDRIDITLGGNATMGLVLQSDIVTFSDQGSDYQSFIHPIDLTSTGSGTIYLGGTAPLCMDRSGWGTIKLSGYNDASRGATDYIRGRFQHCDIDLPFHAALAGRLWESHNMVTIGESVTPGSTKSIGNRIRVHVSAGGREMAQVTGTATSGSAVIAIIPTADLQRMTVGDFVTVSANFPSTTAEYEILAKTPTSITLDTNATSGGSVTLTLATRWNKGVLSKANPGLIGGNTTNGVQPFGCLIEGLVSGYPTSVPLLSDAAAGVTFDLIRVEDGQRYSGRSADFATIGTDANKFSATRGLQLHYNPLTLGNLYFNDNGSTEALIRGVGSRVPTFGDSGGTVVASATTSGWKAQSSSYNGRHLQIGAYHLWYDATGDLRTKNSAPASDTDGTVVGTQT